MKKIIVLALFLTFCGVLSAQSNDSLSLAKTAVFTGQFHTNKAGKRFHLYKGKNGGLFVIRQSKKTLQWYKDYLPKQGQ